MCGEWLGKGGAGRWGLQGYDWLIGVVSAGGVGGGAW